MTQHHALTDSSKISIALLMVPLATLSVSASAAIFDVTQNTWGTTTDLNSMAWAVEEANNTTGTDTIRVSAGLQINVDGAPITAGSSHWLARFTESLNIEGNGATLVNNPEYVTTGGAVATKTNIVVSPYSNPLEDLDAVVVSSRSFALIGTSGEDNSAINVNVTGLNADGLASIAQVYENASVSFSDSAFDNIVNYTGFGGGEEAFAANAGSNLNLSNITLNRNFPFGSYVNAGEDGGVPFGSIAGLDANLNMQDSVINNSFGAGALTWNGGTANVVSSVISNAGGISIGDQDGVLNLVNSLLYLNGGDDPSQTQRVVATTDGVANLIASTVLYDPLLTDLGFCDSVSYRCNGMPLTATLGGTLSVKESAVLPINWDFLSEGSGSLAGKQPYAEFSDGDMTADDYSWIFAPDAQNTAAVRALFDNPILMTDGEAFDTIDIGGGAELLKQLPLGAYPLASGVLPGVIPDAGIGGSNQLINPIDGQPILFDVYGNPRISADGTRTIGAVEASVPVPPVVHAGLLALIGVRLLGRAFGKRAAPQI